MTSKKNHYSHGLINGYRSGLEVQVASILNDAGVQFQFEALKVAYKVPETAHTYTPDFYVMSNGLLIETKGRFVAADRKKILLIKAQHPELEIRLVFSNSKQKISKGSKTTYGMWCEKNGITYADFKDRETWLGWTKEQP